MSHLDYRRDLVNSFYVSEDPYHKRRIGDLMKDGTRLQSVDRKFAEEVSL